MNSVPDPAERYETPEEIAAEIERLMNEAEAMLVGPSHEPLRGRVEDLKYRFSEAQAKLVDLFGSAQRTFSSGLRAADLSIRTRPYHSIAIALGVGVLFGRLIGGARDDY